MSSDEEPDYMSDDFLAQCIPQDVRPGLKRVSSSGIHTSTEMTFFKADINPVEQVSALWSFLKR